MNLTCTSCGQRLPLYTLPDYDEQRDLTNVCDDCRAQSTLRAAREAFAREVNPAPWVQRALDGRLPVKVYA